LTMVVLAKSMTRVHNNRGQQWSLDQVLAATHGRLCSSGLAQVKFAGISTDSRTVQPGDLFVALKGERFDGHDFVSQAVNQGAAGVLVAEFRADDFTDLTVAVVAVADTLKALGDLAAYWRHRHAIPLVAITGSNGKTTTKEMVAAILSRSWRVLKNQGTYNNLVGVPLTLLQMTNSHQAAVVEMGMNRPGEIARLTEIAAPEVGLITNIQPAHLEGVHSIEGVQAAKGELFAGLRSQATIVVNRDDPRVCSLAADYPGRQVGYSCTGVVTDVTVERIIAMDSEGSVFILRLGNETREVQVRIMGRHHLNNAVAAAAVAWSLDRPADDISAALAEFKPFDKRMEVVVFPGNIHIINDSYNANPASVTAALQTLIRLNRTGRLFAVLGDMLELGERSPELHRHVGRLAAEEGVDYLIARGEQARNLLAGAAEAGMESERLSHAVDHREIALKLRSLLASGDWVLVKGSRGMHMEKVVDYLMEEWGNSRS